MDLVTRPWLRDQVRAKLGRQTASDSIPPGPVGEPFASMRFPTNNLINRQLDESISEINLASGFAKAPAPVQYAVSAQTANGPFSIDLAGFPGGLNQVMSAWWEDSSGNVVPLTYTSSYDMGRDVAAYAQMSPSLPRRLFVEGYRAWLWPAPDAPGTLFIRAAVGLLSPQNDQEPISQLSNDEAVGLATIVACEICAQQVDDEVMRERLQYLAPKAQQWRSLIIMALAKQNQSYVPGVTLRSTRVYSGWRSR